MGTRRLSKKLEGIAGSIQSLKQVIYIDLAAQEVKHYHRRYFAAMGREAISYADDEAKRWSCGGIWNGVQKYSLFKQ